MKLGPTLTIASVILVVLAFIIGFAGISGEKVLLPPVVTSIGFFVISWALFSIRDKGRK
ncbi:MAG: hypothetical protein AB7J13_08125 [Pyrinomonadaceae bacterium]